MSLKTRPRKPQPQAAFVVASGVVLLLCACAPVAYVEAPAPSYEMAPPAPVPAPAPALAVAPNPLDQLMAPVALYPDPLISLLLPASTFPSDIASAGAYLSGGGNADQTDSQPWDESVKSLAHYPDVVKWMAQNAAWTQAVGAAFVAQPAEVMSAIQRLRELSRAAGTLTDSDEQRIVVEGNYVEIEPAQPNVLYVPRYDPAVVFVDQPYYGYHGPFFSYGPAYGAGAWLSFGCNWRGGGVLVVGPNYWNAGGGSWHPYRSGVTVNVTVNVRAWNYPETRPVPRAPGGWQSQAGVIHPRLEAGLPAQPPQAAFRNIHTRGASAVAEVAAHPAAFRGKPLNMAIIARPPGSASAHPQLQAGAPARPQPNPSERTGTAAVGDAARGPSPARPGASTAAPVKASAPAKAKEKKKKKAKPARAEERPKPPAPSQ